jgi:hypothetical protein
MRMAVRIGLEVRIEMEMKREIVMDDGDALEERAMERHSCAGARRRACCDAQAREVNTEAGFTLSSCLPILASPSPITEESTDPVSTWRGTKRTDLKLRRSASLLAHTRKDGEARVRVQVQVQVPVREQIPSSLSSAPPSSYTGAVHVRARRRGC